MIADTPDKIFAYKLLALKGALKLETLGLRHSSGKSVAPQIRYLIGSRTKNRIAHQEQENPARPIRHLPAKPQHSLKIKRGLRFALFFTFFLQPGQAGRLG